MERLFSKAWFKAGAVVLKGTFSGFSDDKGPKLSASLAYTTVFSLGPLLLMVMSLASLFFGHEAIQGTVFRQLNGLLGASAASPVQDIIANIRLSGKTRFALITSIVTLFIGASSLFVEIQDSLNVIWRVKAKPKRGWLQFLRNRLLSGSIIISLGFLLVVSLIVNGAVDALGSILSRYLSSIAVVMIQIINLVITYLVLLFLFGVIFKLLPDAKIRWRDVTSGANFTTILFMIGRYVIGLYISTTSTGSIYGAAGSIVVLLVWIYYSSTILYLGAEFTQVYTEFRGRRIEPADYAVHIEKKEIEREVKTLPPQQPEITKK